MHHRTHELGLTSSADPFSLMESGRHYAPDMRLFPVDGQIKLRCALSTGDLSGTVSWVLSQTALSARRLTLDAVDLDIARVWSSRGHRLNYEYTGRKLQIDWPGEASLDGDSLNVEWAVTRPKAGVYFVGQLNTRTEPPYIGVWTDHETERARYWLPCVDHPAVRTRISLELETDVDVTHLGCGLKQSTEVGDFGRRSCWRLEQPCPAYLLCFAAGYLASHSQSTDTGLSLDVFGFEPTTEATLARSFAGTSDMMAWMTNRLGVAFPYPKYWQFVAPGIGGAMENISLTSWDQRFFGDDATHAEFGGWVDIINLHEMAHSYFGDSVVIRDFAHAWLKEGWATYMESVWLGETVDVDTGHWLLQEDRLAYLDEVTSRYERPVITREFDHSWHMYDRHLYQGSAWRIHMLRSKLGEADFWAATKGYLTEYASKCAETDDFRRCLENASGFHLSRFFEDWFRRPGCPSLSLSMTTSGGDQRVVSASVVMDKPSDGGEFFELDVQVALLDDSKQWRTKPLVIQNGRASVSFDLEGDVQQIVLDPHGTQLFKMTSDVSSDIYAGMVVDCPHVVGRVQAAQALAAKGDRKSVMGLRTAYEKESHFGLRRILAKIVAEKKTGWRVGLLLEWLADEVDPRVRFVVAQGLSGVRLTQHQADAVRALLNQVDGQFIKGTLMEVLGAQRAIEDLPLFQSCIMDSEQTEPLRQSALTALGAHGTIEAYQCILSMYDKLSESVYLTGQRHRSLAQCARHLDRHHRQEAASRFEVASRDVVGAEALALAGACVTLGEPSGGELLSNLLASVDHQSASNVQHMLSKIKQSGTQAQVDARVDKLEERIRVLEQALNAQLDIKGNQSKD